MANATATQTCQTIGAYTVLHEVCEDGFSWHVLDADGSAIESFKTERKALKDVAERIAEDEAEAAEEAAEYAREQEEEMRQDELNSLKAKLEAVLEGCDDPDKLRAALALLKS